MRPRAISRGGMLVLLAWLATGCEDPQPGIPAADLLKPDAPAVKMLRIGAVLPMFSHPFFVAQKKGMEAKAQELKVQLSVRDGQDEDRTQLAQMAALVNVGADAIILCPRDEEALVPAVESANRQRVPVVVLNRRVNGGRAACYVGADDLEGGKAQGKALIEALGAEGGKILYLQGTQGSSPQRQRALGFRAALETHPEILIADERFADFQEDRAKSVMTSLVQRFRPGDIRAIVAQSGGIL